MNEKKKESKKSTKVEDAVSHIFEVLESIDNRLMLLEIDSHESIDFFEDVNSLDLRVSKVEGRMGYSAKK